MKKVKFVQDAKLDPGRYYRNPSDIIRDRRLTQEDRLQIVIAWEQTTRRQLDGNEVADGLTEEKLLHLQRLREDLEQNLEGAGD